MDQIVLRQELLRKCELPQEQERRRQVSPNESNPERHSGLPTVRELLVS